MFIGCLRVLQKSRTHILKSNSIQLFEKCWKKEWKKIETNLGLINFSLKDINDWFNFNISGALFLATAVACITPHLVTPFTILLMAMGEYKIFTNTHNSFSYSFLSSGALRGQPATVGAPTQRASASSLTLAPGARGSLWRSSSCCSPSSWCQPSSTPQVRDYKNYKFQADN